MRSRIRFSRASGRCARARILSLLRAGGEMGAGQLAARLHVHVSTVIYHLDRLACVGLVELGARDRARGRELRAAPLPFMPTAAGPLVAIVVHEPGTVSA